MKLAQTLVDKAIEKCNGSPSELARRIAVYPTDISKLRAGTRPLSPEIAAELAEVAGLDARQAAIDAIIERNMANRKGPLLSAILGKGLAAGVAGMLLIFYSNDSISATSTMKNDSASINTSIHRIYWMLRRMLSTRKNCKSTRFRALRLKPPGLLPSVEPTHPVGASL